MRHAAHACACGRFEPPVVTTFQLSRHGPAAVATHRYLPGALTTRRRPSRGMSAKAEGSPPPNNNKDTATIPCVEAKTDPEAEEAQAYLDSQGVSTAVSDALQQVVLERSPDAIGRIAEILASQPPVIGPGTAI